MRETLCSRARGRTNGQQGFVEVLHQFLVSEGLSLAHVASETQVEICEILLGVQPEQRFPVTIIHSR